MEALLKSDFSARWVAASVSLCAKADLPWVIPVRASADLVKIVTGKLDAGGGLRALFCPKRAFGARNRPETRRRADFTRSGALNARRVVLQLWNRMQVGAITG
jgi:hypothetical protein